MEVKSKQFGTLHFNGDGSCNRRARLCRGVLSDSPRTKTRVAAFTEATRLVALHSHVPWWSFERGCRSREPLGSMEYDVRRARSTYQERRPLTNGTERFESVYIHSRTVDAAAMDHMLKKNLSIKNILCCKTSL